MLNFDDNHVNVEGNINEKRGNKKVKKAIIMGLILANLMTFSGCSKNMPCDIEENHAHFYANNDYVGRYIVSEKSKISGLTRFDNYIIVDKEYEDLLKFANKKGLFRIDENQSAIKNITDNHFDYTEYRYSYRYRTHIRQKIGKISHTITIPKTGYSWTTDTTKNLTGEERVCHYVYYGYKIIKNEKGKYEIIKSEPVEDLKDLPEGYDYVKEKFYEVVNYYDRKEVFNYEDGPEDDKELITEEEYNNSQGKSL